MYAYAEGQSSASGIFLSCVYECHTDVSGQIAGVVSVSVLGIELTGTELRLGSKQFSTVLSSPLELII